MAVVWIRSGDLTDFGAVGRVFGDGEGLVFDDRFFVDIFDIDGEVFVFGFAASIGGADTDIIVIFGFKISGRFEDELVAGDLETGVVGAGGFTGEAGGVGVAWDIIWVVGNGDVG